jgi:hypothetical protein
MLFVWGKKGRWNASELAQKAQVGKRVPLQAGAMVVLEAGPLHLQASALHLFTLETFRVG